MGSAIPFSDDEPFETKVKALADDELLEIWEQSQQLENFLNAQMEDHYLLAPEYEETIIRELALRIGRRFCAGAFQR